MLGKRKCPFTDRGDTLHADQSSAPPTVLDLTKVNLHAFNAQSKDDAISAPSRFPPPYDTMARTPAPSPSKNSASRSTTTSATRAEDILQSYRIFLDRLTPMPPDLQKLVDSLRIRSTTEITPNSKFVAKGNKATRTMQEDNALHELADKLIYRCKLYPEDDTGEPLLARGRSDQWRDTVPKPSDAPDNDALQAAMDVIGCPPRPKPDLSFGYSDEAFDVDLHNRRKALPDELLVLPRQPWYPYLVVEWKSPDVALRFAEQQARRDAAAAIDTLYQLLRMAEPTVEPSPAITCVFSLCVDDRLAEYRVHWRHVDSSDGLVSYEAERIRTAVLHDEEQVFDTRTAITKALAWVRGERLMAIRTALRGLKPPPKPLRYDSSYGLYLRARAKLTTMVGSVNLPASLPLLLPRCRRALRVHRQKRREGWKMTIVTLTARTGFKRHEGDSGDYKKGAR